MMLRMLLVLVAVAGLSVGGCKKEEPTPADTMDQMKQEAEKAAEEAQPAAEEAAADVKEAVE
ncbi:MAG: hypothetical protein ACYS72_05625 [Planctomycetota bacterium]